MSEKDVTVRELMRHIPRGEVAYVRRDGTGTINRGLSGEGLVWNDLDQLARKLDERKRQLDERKRKTAEKLVLEAAVALFHWHDNDSLGKRDDLDRAVIHLESLGADDD